MDRGLVSISMQSLDNDPVPPSRSAGALDGSGHPAQIMAHARNAEPRTPRKWLVVVAVALFLGLLSFGAHWMWTFAKP